MFRFRSIRRAVPASALALVLLAGAVNAASPQPAIVVDEPAAGQTVSRAAGSMPVSGVAQFAAPSPTDTSLYLRYAAVGANNCGRRYLSEDDGPDPGNSCQSTGAHLTLAGQSFMRDWPADQEVALPLTIDASRNITGEVNITSRIQGNAAPGNWVILDVVVQLNSTRLTQSFDSGPFTGSARKFAVDIDIPDSLDKVDATSVQVELIWHRVVHLSQQGVSVIHTYAELENPPTFLSVPTYSASFSRRVNVSVDNPNFTGGTVNATVDVETGAFSASYPTTFLPVGSRTLYARAVQGGVASATQSVPFTLTN
ncbi:MAG: hypothetical protein M3245_01905 [Actinomycetota bacterium]|nr:hypothetical protein [Actinomycetota bacterium]